MAESLPDFLFSDRLPSLLRLDELIPIIFAALSGISRLSSGGGDRSPESSTSTDGRLEVGLEAEPPGRRPDLVLEGGGGALPRRKLENPIPRFWREDLASAFLSLSEVDDLSPSFSDTRCR